MRNSRAFGQFIKQIKTLRPVLVLAIAAAAAVLIFSHGRPPSAPASLQTLARQVLEKCAKTSYHATCYESEIPKLMDQISLEDAFAVASMVQDNDPAYNYCHVLGHNLSARETAKNPDNWAQIIHRCPTGICSNGCLHGAAQERFRGEVLTGDQLAVAKKELIGVCDATANWQITGLEQAECFHGLGHLTMYMTGADLTKTLGICDEIAHTKSGGDQTKLCYEGAFMQLFQPLDQDDSSLVAGIGPKKKEDLLSYCQSFGKSAWQDACWTEGFAMYNAQVSTAAGTVDYCSKARPEVRSNCYSMLFYVRAQGTNYDPAQLADFCAQIPAAVRGQCFGDVANAIIHGGLRLIDRAAAFCGYAKDTNSRDQCYLRVLEFATYNVPVASGDFEKLCRDLPEPYQEQCLNKKSL